MTPLNTNRGLSPRRSRIYRIALFALAISAVLAFISICPYQSYRTSAATERIAETTAIPSATPEVFTIEPSQMARGTSRTIEINIRECPKKKFGDAKNVFAEGDLNTLKGKGIEITGGQVLGECKYSAELKVADSALFGPVAVTFHYTEAEKDQTQTLIIRIVSEEPTPPGPLVPGLDPQVDVMWSVVPQRVVKDNFGIRVGKLFYCLEVVIGNSTGYDLQIAAVGFQLGPTGKHVETVMKSSAQVAKTMQSAQDASFQAAFSKIPGDCKTTSGDNFTAYLDCVSQATKNEIDKVTASQARVVAAVQAQRDFLATLPPNNPGSKLPAASYRMTRGSIEHGQFWNLRDTSIRLIKALGPVLTGFTPYFHVLNHQRNYAEAINIFSNPFEKGIELVFPDETIQQLQRLDEQTLRDGMIIQNNRQIRTRTFIPKDVLHLDKPYRDDPVVVMMSLGKLHIIGDLIQYKNRISVTSNPSGAVVPPPTVNQGTFILSLGDTNKTFNVSGTFLEGARLEADDPANIDVGPTTSTEKTASAPVTIKPTATVGQHTFRLITKGGLASIPVTFTQPKPVIEQTKTKFEPSQPTVNTPDTYRFEVTGRFFQTAKLSVPDSSKNAIELVSTDPEVSEGGTKLVGKFKVSENLKKGGKHFYAGRL